MSTTRHHIEMDHYDSEGNRYILFPKNTLDDVVMTMKSDETLRGKIIFYGVCSTPATTVDKTVIATGFTLTNGQHITVAFTNEISVTSATLNVNSLGAKPLYRNGAPLEANIIPAGARVEMVYDGANFNVISGASNTITSKLMNKKIYLTGTTSDETSVRKNEYYDTGVYITAESGTLHAESFEGKVNADNITDGTLDPERLGLSGVASGTYGTPSDHDIDLGTGGFFMVPNLTIDSHGRVTSASEAQVYFPAAPNDKVKTEPWSNGGSIKLVGTIDGGTGSLFYYPNIYIDSQYGELCTHKIYTKNIEFEIDYGDNDYAYIDGIDYSGTAAKSKTTNSITAHIVDSTSEKDAKGVTTKALSANQGYILYNKIKSFDDYIDTHSDRTDIMEESITDLESEYNDLQNDFDEFKESFQDGCDEIASTLTALDPSGSFENSPSAISEEIEKLVGADYGYWYGLMKFVEQTKNQSLRKVSYVIAGINTGGTYTMAFNDSFITTAYRGSTLYGASQADKYIQANIDYLTPNNDDYIPLTATFTDYVASGKRNLYNDFGFTNREGLTVTNVYATYSSTSDKNYIYFTFTATQSGIYILQIPVNDGNDGTSIFVYSIVFIILPFALNDTTVRHIIPT